MIYLLEGRVLSWLPSPLAPPAPILNTSYRTSSSACYKLIVKIFESYWKFDAVYCAFTHIDSPSRVLIIFKPEKYQRRGQEYRRLIWSF